MSVDIKTQITIEGNLKGFIDRVKLTIHNDVIKPAVEEHAQKVLKTAQALVPVDEGKLRDSLEAEVSSGGHFAKVKANYKKQGNHAHLVHFGTVHMPGRPFLYQAADQHKAEFVQKLKSLIDKQA